mmetsp:Transcript_13431/g.29167  ORF Transcript_13431/g.29167 Transcript_13431/m.29167 type:complete len:236 (-) Transcript_13431:319-1026(-)|eukprot:CAMPEP_0172314432 /NCGR_PEP_ID=MMETSP1058-20130122/22531_1 /TAXON_ID=83371 /ORGANISM="Detonula confervacea, Strain CCMP 353" /LENGTH=235 /DNA_ID=CAMNT_0013028299 /DNA_START=52 /DNA_END=759 /DNA_ORIENTATION=-
MEQGGSSSATSSAPVGKKAHRKGPKTNKPKITKEERRAKYTDIARNRRQAKETKQRDQHVVCYRCRKTGHSVENCRNAPESADGGGGKAASSTKKKGGNICYKCGSIEHRIQMCPKIKPFLKGKGAKSRIDFGKIGDLPYANCYVCNKSGHLSSHCPESTKGLYPLGGSCRECGSVYHYAVDCPETKKGKKGPDDNDDDASNASVKSVTIDQFLDEPVVEEKVEKSKKKKTVVNF